MIATRGKGSLGWLLVGAAWVGIAISGNEAAAQQPTGAAEADRGSGATTRARASKSGARSKKSSDGQGDQAPAPKLDAAAAQREVEAGINALVAGKPAESVAHLSAALTAGSLPSTQTARALYYRGVAHRKAGRPASAISDLTSALWLKGGLTPQQRTDALDNRAAAYREAGLSDQVAGEVVREPAASPIVAPRTRTAAAPPAGASNSGAPYTILERPAAQQPAQNSGGLGGIFGSWFSGGSAAPQPTQTSARPSPPATTASVTAPLSVPTGFEGASEVFGSGVATPPTARSTAPAARASSSSWSTTATLRSAAPARAESDAATRKAPVVARSWSNATKVKTAERPTAPARSAVATPSPARPALATAAVRSRASHGSYQVQVAAVRSAEEAAGVAAQVQNRFARDLGGRAPVVDQTVVGNIGTLYRVQIGPFASAGETNALCSKLKGAGMDCRIVAAAE